MPKYASSNVYGLRKRARSPPPKKAQSLTTPYPLHRYRATKPRTTSASKVFTYRLHRPVHHIPKPYYPKRMYRPAYPYPKRSSLSKKTYASKKATGTRRVGNTGQDVSLGAEWRYEELSVTKERICNTTADSAGDGLLGFGVNLSPTISTMGAATSTLQGSTYKYIYQTMGPAGDPRYVAYAKLFNYFALQSVDIKCFPVANSNWFDNRPNAQSQINNPGAPVFEGLHSWTDMETINQDKYPPDSVKAWPYLQGYEYTANIPKVKNWHRTYHLEKYAADASNNINWQPTANCLSPPTNDPNSAYPPLKDFFRGAIYFRMASS